MAGPADCYWALAGPVERVDSVPVVLAVPLEMGATPGCSASVEPAEPAVSGLSTTVALEGPAVQGG